MPTNEEIILDVFEALERRDRKTLFDLWHDDIELHDAEPLPYADQAAGKQAMWKQLEEAPHKTWIGTWGPLQPTEAERRLDPRIVASRGEEVVVQYTTRAVSPDGERFESDVLGIYVIRDGQAALGQDVPLRHRRSLWLPRPCRGRAASADRGLAGSRATAPGGSGRSNGDP